MNATPAGTAKAPTKTGKAPTETAKAPRPESDGRIGYNHGRAA